MSQVSSAEAYQLLHNGILALSQVEANGICIDTKYLDKTIKRSKQRIHKLETQFRDSDLGKLWRKTFGAKTNFDSNQQLGQLLFDKLGFEGTKTTAGNYKTDVATLEKVEHPMIAPYMEISKLKHTLNTFLMGVKREVVRDKAHVFYNLHTAATYRSSSSAFNFQNLPIRDPVQGETIRRCFKARPGRRLVEIDYSGIEVCIAACYHQDPVMIEYITDPSKDMHRDMAAQCFCISPEQVTKAARYAGKNMFVFPQFYGDYFISCARSMWEWMERNKLKTADTEESIKDVLKSKGIKRLGACDPKERPRPGTFEQHIKKVEQDFWGRRFKVYNEWKQNWFQQYQKTGGFRTKTGFYIKGNFGRNDVINYPVQGSAFHCLLWSLIEIQKELRKRGMKTLIVGQIHDSIIADVPDNELDEYLAIARHVMTVRLPKRWKWICVPLEVEAEVTPVNGSWHEKKTHEVN